MTIALGTILSLCFFATPQQSHAEQDLSTPITHSHTTQHAKILSLSKAESGQSLIPYMDYMVDVSGMTTLLELFSPSYKDAFTPLEQGIPLAATGSTWLRLSVAPDSDNSHIIALGSELATDVVLYVPDFSQYAENIEQYHSDSAASQGANHNALENDTSKARTATPWQEVVIPHGEAITLPAITDAELLKQLQGLSVPVYIHMSGTPEPWFAPQLRSITDIAHDNSHLIHMGITMMLAAVLALCLLRAFTEKGQWRLWTTFFTLALLVQSLVGLPITPHGSIGFAGLPNVLAPAVALMLLPHIARHMLRRTEFSTKYILAKDSQLDADLDQQYRFLSIPCILIAIVPLLPSMGWLGKLLPLWPLAIIIFLPTTAIAIFRHIAGAKLFFCGCLAGIIAALCAMFGMLMDMPATLINAIPLFGTALTALLIAGANITRGMANQQVSHKKQGNTPSKGTFREECTNSLVGEDLRIVSADEGLATGVVVDGKVIKNPVITINTDTDDKPRETSNTLEKLHSVQVPDADTICTPDANTNTTETNQTPDNKEDTTSNSSPTAQELFIPIAKKTDTSDATVAPNATLVPNANAATETPSEPAQDTSTVATTPSQSLSANLRNITQDEVHSLIRAEEAMRYPLETLRKSMDALQKYPLSPESQALCHEALNASKQLDLVGEEFRRAAYRLPEEPASVFFDLQRCLREAHDNVCARSDAKNIALSWFMAPHLVQTYQGDADRLRTTLRVLMESAVDATDKGSVYLSARRVPDSTNPGHLLFTITDTGAGGPPERRKASAVMQAWELATNTGGSLSIDSGKHGTTISFSMRFLAIHNDNVSANILGHHSSTSTLLDPLGQLDGPSYAMSGKDASVIIGAPAASNRQLLAFYLENTAYYADEAVSYIDIMAKYANNGAELIILDGDMTEAEITKVITTARQYEQENDLMPVPFLALVRDEDQANAFLQLGCTQTLLKPVTRSGLCAQVALLAPIVVLPKNTDMEDNELHELETEDDQHSTVTPELINSALTEAMELLTNPAQQIPNEENSSIAPVTTDAEANTTDIESTNLACSSVSDTTSAVPDVQPDIPQLATPAITFESIQPSVTTPTPPAPEVTQASVPTSEAEDITLRIFDEYIHKEKSSVSPDMLDLDPILFTDITSEPKPKSKTKSGFGKSTDSSPKVDQQISAQKNTEARNKTEESVSSPRAATTRVQNPVAIADTPVAPNIPVEAVAPIAATTLAETVEAVSLVNPAESTTPVTSTSTPTFVYTDTESEVSTPRPVKTTESQTNGSPVNTCAPAPKQEPTGHGNEVYLEEVSVGNEVLRIYKVPTKPIDPDAEYDAMLEREAMQDGQTDRPSRDSATQTWTNASDLIDNTDNSNNSTHTHSADVNPVCEVHEVAEVSPVANVAPVAEVEPVAESIDFADTAATPQAPELEAVPNAPDMSTLVQEAIDFTPIHRPVQEATQVSNHNTTTEFNTAVATEHVQRHDVIQQAEPLEPALPPQFKPVFEAPQDFAPQEAPNTATQYATMQDDYASEVTYCDDSDIPELEPTQDPALVQERNFYSDDEQDLDNDPDYDSADESDYDAENSNDDKEPSAVARATATLFAMCTSLAEPAPLRIKDKALPSFNSLRKAFEMAAASNNQADENATEPNNEPHSEDPGPRFVSITQSVNELAATIKPTPSILRHSSKKDFVPKLITELQNSLNDASNGYQQGDVTMMQDSAARIADTAEALGLRALERHTRCVERAAQAGDLSSARELYPDMEDVVQRTISALHSSGLNGAHRV